MMFSEAIDRIPTAIGTGPGRGLTISLLKALTHASVIRATDSTEYASMTGDIIKEEIAAIADHLSPERLLVPTAASEEFNQLLAKLHEIGKALAAEAKDWNEQTMRDNLGALTDRIITVCQNMDFELAGINTAEAGDQL